MKQEVRLETREPIYSGHDRIVVDLDGTLIPDEWPKLGMLLPGAAEAMRELLDLGFQVVVNSTRLSVKQIDEKTDRELAERLAEQHALRRLLDEAGLQEVVIWTHPWKPGALAYIDDKAIRFTGSWPKAMADLKRALRLEPPAPVQTPSQRAVELVRGARQTDYGHPLDNHERIAAFWTVRLKDKLLPGVEIEPHEAAAMMRLTKESRLMQTPGHDDSLVDIPGYADVEWEIHRERRRRAQAADEEVEALHVSDAA